MSDLGECPFCRQPLTTGYVHEVVVTRPPQWALDAIDGAALRELREALPARAEVRIHKRPTRSSREYPIGISGSHWQGIKYGHTIAEAADACREALEPDKGDKEG